ncbi:MAG TPA: hypothetical protein PLE19_07645 [Planctomycetota bacterium]|nr:hypothetical protein [Planctomycetota bacterium]HRR78944.1 hypothetical protein [Planctomycetota bacterium]HRT92778.1 hypothetical protein [Planctomycetota bacterium]
MPESTAPQAVDPDELLADVKRQSFLRTVAASTVVHVIVILLTSIGYIGLMRQYKSWHPRIEMKRLAKEQREREDEQRRKEAHDKFLADQAKKKAGEKGGDEKGTPAPTSATKAEGDKPKVLKDIEAKSSERPKESSMKLNELDAP